jgi:superoxide dismutase, Cu-Zn family
MRSHLLLVSLGLLLWLSSATIAQAASANNSKQPDHKQPDKQELPYQAPTSQAITVPMAIANEQGTGSAIGTVAITETPYGVVLTPALTGITAGLHGFHIHENPSCAAQKKDGKMVPALAAGGHYDPAETKQHGLPWGDGHLGDLPALYVDPTGKASNPVLAPRLKLKNLLGRALMIHVGGDNYADQPAPLGGGGGRVACGVIPAPADRSQVQPKAMPKQ